MISLIVDRDRTYDSYFETDVYSDVNERLKQCGYMQLTFDESNMREGCRAIGDALKVDCSITRLYIHREMSLDFSSECWLYLCEGLMENASVTQLELKSHYAFNFEDRVCEAFGEVFKKNRTIKRLFLGSIVANSSGFIRMWEGLEKNVGIERIRLDFKEEWMLSALGKALKHNRSISAVCCGGPITSSVCAEICNGLIDSNIITELKLCGVTIGAGCFDIDRGCIALSKLLSHISSLTQLDLSQNMISDVGGIALFKALKVNNSLTYLNISRNCIESDGCIALAEALQVNDVITDINLSANGYISSCAWLVLLDALMVRDNVPLISTDKQKLIFINDQNFRKYKPSPEHNTRREYIRNIKKRIRDLLERKNITQANYIEFLTNFDPTKHIDIDDYFDFIQTRGYISYKAYETHNAKMEKKNILQQQHCTIKHKQQSTEALKHKVSNLQQALEVQKQQHEIAALKQMITKQQYDMDLIKERHEAASIKQQYEIALLKQQHEIALQKQQYEIAALKQTITNQQYDMDLIKQEHEIALLKQQHEIALQKQQLETETLKHTIKTQQNEIDALKTAQHENEQ